jgi:hypothetical protein
MDVRQAPKLATARVDGLMTTTRNIWICPPTFEAGPESSSSQAALQKRPKFRGGSRMNAIVTAAYSNRFQREVKVSA